VRVERFVASGGARLVRSIKGTLQLELIKSDGALYRTTVLYNDASQPSVKLMMTANYAAMQRGELSGRAAVLNRSLKFEGALGFLIALGR